MSCLFCKIIKGEIPSTKVFENEEVFAFRDIHPLAKEHILFIHKKHTENLLEMNPKDVATLMSALIEYTKESSAFKKGARVVSNIGEHGGQGVFHTHFHLLGGERLKGFGA